MMDRPILFSAPMVRALLDGRKTQTRRLAQRSINTGCDDDAPVYAPSLWRRVKPGDRLWVRESCSLARSGLPVAWYWADGNPTDGDWTKPRPSIHMPRWASRITLDVADVRVERLQSISEQDAIAEGAVEDWADGLSVWYFPGGWELGVERHGETAREGFRWLWTAINGNWDHNPEVVALSFAVIRANVDRLKEAA